MSLEKIIKAYFPLGVVEILRGLRDTKNYIACRQKYGDSSLFSDILWSIAVHFSPEKTILFFPQRPCPGMVEYKLCALLGHKIVTNPKQKFDLAFKRLDATFFDPTTLQSIPIEKGEIINGRSIDISKRAVSRAFARVFGYALEVDPVQYVGSIVEKSDTNCSHDGRVLLAPISSDAVRSGYVYQKAIDNSSDKEGLVLDYRVPIHQSEIPLVYLKYRPIESRFSNKNAFVTLAEPSDVFSPEEIDRLLALARTMGLDYGELDVLRDSDRQIYVVDVNNTPAGPPNGLPPDECKTALTRLCKTFDRMLCENRMSKTSQPVESSHVLTAGKLS